ncbi:MAG: formate dehydrogenase subunit delta [Ferrovibrionaceae bacterium]
MSGETVDRLVMMANQIGKFFAPQRKIDQAAAIADHLEKFWDPRMRSLIVAHLDAGGTGLDPMVFAAVEKMKVSMAARRSTGAAAAG